MDVAISARSLAHLSNHEQPRRKIHAVADDDEFPPVLRANAVKLGIDLDFGHCIHIKWTHLPQNAFPVVMPIFIGQ